jgi:hypothetical protein
MTLLSARMVYDMENSMNAKCTAILTDPHPCSHIVYPYTDETHVTDAVCLFATAGFRQNEAVGLIMSADHTGPIERRLEREGFDLHSLKESGQLICEEAEVLLRRFMVNGMPDEALFKNTISPIIDRLQKSAGPDQLRTVRLFGEMVSLLWIVSQTAAELLEKFWKDVIDVYSVSLLCTYALATGVSPASFPEPLRACHSHAVAFGD